MPRIIARVGFSISVGISGWTNERNVAGGIDDPWVPDSFAEHYATLSGNRSFRRVLLMPSRAAIIERIAERGNPWDHILIHEIPRLYDYLEPMPKDGWMVLDSSTWSTAQTLCEAISKLGLDSGTTQS